MKDFNLLIECRNHVDSKVNTNFMIEKRVGQMYVDL